MIEVMIDFMIGAFALGIVLMLVSAIIPLTIGLLTMYHLLRTKKEPADITNRINHIRLWWFALTRENLFVDTFDWLRRDELDNLK